MSTNKPTVFTGTGTALITPFKDGKVDYFALTSLIERQITAGVELNIFGLTLQNANIAVSVLVLLFIVGYFLFCKADKLNKARQA